MAQDNALELLEIADLSVKAASALRAARTRQATPDAATLNRAISFLTSADQAGEFMETGQLDASIDTLQPLNLAFATLRDHRQMANYSNVTRYLERINNCLKDLLRNQMPSEPKVLDDSEEFFAALGKLTVSQLSQRMTRDSFEIQD